MKLRFLAPRRLTLAFVMGTCFLSALVAQSDSGRARIALYEPVGQKEDAALAAVLSAVADSVELSLTVLQRYDVRRLPPVDPAQDLQKVRAYCRTNRIDQAILGSGSARSGGGYDFRLLVYDHLKDSVTFDKTGTSNGALDMFDTTDELVASLLDGLSGTHLLFGSLSVVSDPTGATVAVNGKEVGPAPVSLRGLPAGMVQVTAHDEGREDATASVKITDGETSDAALTLVRSTGKLALKVPADAVVSVRSAEIGEKRIEGSGETQLPTGEYEAQASCAGLQAVSQRITIRRNETSDWLPWQKGYLDVQSVPAGSAILVDGEERGVAPLVVEVEPGTLHRVELKKDKYEEYLADIRADAGNKVIFSGRLMPLPGSIRVETSIAGAIVDLDDKAGFGETPATFDNIPAGEHVIRIGDMTVRNRVYTIGDPIRVVVGAGEAVTVSKTFVEGKAHLLITDAPAGSVWTIDGQKVTQEGALTTGVEIPAGTMAFDVTAPDSQHWTGVIYCSIGDEVKRTLSSMVWEVPQRKIAMDGNPDDWKGLVPFWGADLQYGFPSQPGTSIARGFMCRDDAKLYFRYEFKNGTPTTNLTKEVGDNFEYVATVSTLQGRIQASIWFHRFLTGGRITTHLGVWKQSAGQWTDLGTNTISYRIGQNALDVAIPLASIKSYLKGDYLVSQLLVEKVNSSETWQNGTGTDERQVLFSF